ncbi:MAG: DNA polymerase III subunit gamma/tau [Anaerolineae bacterium]
MATQALYRRWRPQTFDDVIGQDHITQTLRSALATHRVAHAYLFTGPRGTGKTSVARILAKAVNCLAPLDQRPCNQCRICHGMSNGSHLDLIEIDAASNTGVDDVRDLREKINFSPNEARQKVYVIDEVHMLSNAAFNALLKTLEEPPAHALFVLATTEPHKIPETIRSRCQRFDFRRVSLQSIIGKLERICEAEGAVAEPAALEAIARAATGSLRDSESLLDQLLAFAEDTIALEQVQGLLGTVAGEAVAALVDHLVDRNTPEGLALINQTVDAGADPRQFTRQLLEYLRGLLLLQVGDRDLVNVTDDTLKRMQAQVERLPAQRLVKIIRCFAEADFNLKIGAQPQLPLELAFVEMTLDAMESAVRDASSPARPSATEGRAVREAPAPNERTPRDRRQPVAEVEFPSSRQPFDTAQDEARDTASPTAATDPPATQAAVLGARPSIESGEDEPSGEPRTGSEPSPAGDGGTIDLGTVEANWDELLLAIRPHSRMVEALLKDCKPIAVDGDVVTLGFFYPFHRERVEEPKSKSMVTAMLGRVLRAEVQVRCVMVDKSTAAQEVQKRRPKDKYQQAAEDPVIQAAVERFGARIAGIESSPLASDDEEE